MTTNTPTTTRTRRKARKFFRIELQSEPNPDFNQRAPISPKETATAPTLEKLEKKVAAYMARYGLGGGNWPSPDVVDETGKVVGRFSYNLRFWTPEQWSKFEEELRG